MSNTAPSRAEPVVVFPLGRWCPPQETSQPHPPQWTDMQMDVSHDFQLAADIRLTSHKIKSNLVVSKIRQIFKILCFRSETWHKKKYIITVLWIYSIYMKLYFNSKWGDMTLFHLKHVETNITVSVNNCASKKTKYTILFWLLLISQQHYGLYT